jgi:hypothetical protein
MPPKVGTRDVPDESNYRTGWLLDEGITEKMLEEAHKAKKMINKDQVAAKQTINKVLLTECMDILRGIIMMAYPGYYGLPDWEPCRLFLENRELENPNFDENNFFYPEKTVMWWAGKELRGKLLNEFCGKNEKTKIVVKFTKKGGQPPSREPLIDEKTHKEMLSYYHKKTQDEKVRNILELSRNSRITTTTST